MNNILLVEMKQKRVMQLGLDRVDYFDTVDCIVVAQKEMMHADYKQMTEIEFGNCLDKVSFDVVIEKDDFVHYTHPFATADL